ncbi:hypothetical protein LZC95_48110 [Pendulispora brunnea]|uniref:DUF333 domain-containing protein n=1 Tax=Pendulispora brunnea TaxID=2905690 RepID=A0ABZ2K679_9BACT
MKLSRLVWMASSVIAFVACDKSSEAPKEGASSAAVASAKAAPSAAPSSNAGGTLYSCNQPSAGLCAEWRGLSAGKIAEAKGSCNDPGSVFSTKPCDTKGVLGTCEQPKEHITLFISKNPAIATAKDAKEILCDDGKFTALAP